MRKITEIVQEDNMAEFLFSCRTDFKFFCERVLGLTDYGGIHAYQIEWFDLAQRHDRVIIRAPAGFAKTTILGVAYPLWLIFTKKNLQILLVSKTITQSKDALLMQIKNHIEDNELLRELMPKDRDKTWSQTQLRTTNNSTIINRPYSDSIKGYRADIIILDEIDSYEDPNIFFDHVLSRLNPRGKIIGITTPEEGPMRLVNMIEMRNLEKQEYVIKTYTAIVDYEDPKNLESGRSIWPERFSMEELLKRRTAMGEAKWQKNYMCNLVTESSNAIFPGQSIELCKDYKRGFTNEYFGGEVYMGCDFAIASGPTADYDAYVIVEKVGDLTIIKHAETHRGLPVQQKVQRIKELYEKYKPLFITCDESSIGAAIIEELRVHALPIDPQSFQSRARNVLLNNLKVLLDNHRIVIPKYQEDLQAVNFANRLEIELLGFKEQKLTASSSYSSYVSTAVHDDTVMALAMAVKRIKIIKEFDDYIGVG